MLTITFQAQNRGDRQTGLDHLINARIECQIQFILLPIQPKYESRVPACMLAAENLLHYCAPTLLLNLVESYRFPPQLYLNPE